jgi:hypothetical protein
MVKDGTIYVYVYMYMYIYICIDKAIKIVTGYGIVLDPYL